MAASHTITLRREPGPLTRSLTALVLRGALGLVFLMAGIQKFQMMKGPEAAYPKQMVESFKDSPLRPELVKLFADVLPYAELGLGAALLAGALTTLTSFLTGVLLLHLLFGIIILGDPTKFPDMIMYILVDAGILWLSPVTSNYLSVDGLIFGWFWKPRREGDYRLEEGAVAGRR